jgi:carbamoyltransferase
MDVLGINAVYHDSAACLVRDGRIIAAAEEERFNRVKHGKRPVPFSTWELPFGAIDYCLREGDTTLARIDHIAYSYDPTRLLEGHAAHATLQLPLEPTAAFTSGESSVYDGKDWDSPWDPLFVSYIVNAPRQLASAAPHHLKARFAGVTGDELRAKWHYVDHHVAHAASAFLPSPHLTAAVLTMDGRGEAATTTYSRGHGTQLDLIGEVVMPDSIGLLYEYVTDHLGFLRSSDEYKVMALASYVTDADITPWRDVIRVHGGDYTVDMDAVGAIVGEPRTKGSAFERRHYEIAAGLQWAVEEAALKLVRWLHDETGETALCMAGGVALNCVMNSRIRDEGPFEQVWVQPAAGDSGTALGAALCTDASVRPHERVAGAAMDDAFFGPGYTDEDIEEFLRWSKLPYERSDDVAGDAARLLANDRIVGWFQGRMEFGPRALGGRSILASPLSEGMRERLNDIKDREDFRPVAPVVLEERAAEYFDGPAHSPFMLFVHQVRPEVADRIPAVRHVDNTARIQTITAQQHPAYHGVVSAFADLTGVPVLINTSFNTRGEPIVCSPRDAIECFWTSPLDDLVIGSFVLHKEAVGRQAFARDAASFGEGSPGEAWVARRNEGVPASVPGTAS